MWHPDRRTTGYLAPIRETVTTPTHIRIECLTDTPIVVAESLSALDSNPRLTAMMFGSDQDS